MPEPLARYREGSSLPFLAPVQPVPTIADVIFRSLGAAGLVFGVCILSQWIVYTKLYAETGIRYATPVIAAAVTGVVTYRMLRMERLQAIAIGDRFHAIAEANHHIRNALQSLSYQRYLTEDTHVAERLLDAVNRIQWVLNEVFPRLETPDLRRKSRF